MSVSFDEDRNVTVNVVFCQAMQHQLRRRGKAD